MLSSMLLLSLASVLPQVRVVRDTGEVNTVEPSDLKQLNGNTLTWTPSYLDAISFYNPKTIFGSGDSLSLKCADGSSTGCVFYLVTYQCNACDNQFNGGIVGQLLTSGWTSRGSDCAPRFRSNGYDKQPMVVFRKYFGAGDEQSVSITSEARYIGIYHSENDVGGKDNWCTSPYRHVGPQLPAECGKFCVADIPGTEVTIPGLGKVNGKVEGTHNVFRGVPYAPQPEFFKYSTLVTHYSHDIYATANGPMCWQPGSKGNGKTVVDSCHNETSDGSYSWQRAWSTLDVSNSSTDCLNLNIFVPQSGGDSLPVMVFIPGGGFYSGGSNDEQLAKSFSEYVILVIVNYRLGVQGFGFLDEMLPENGGTGANFGLIDQQRALEYVKKYIQSFGGDNNRITIFGESAGGTSIAYHYVTPASQLYFNRAILESAGTAQMNTRDWGSSDTLQLAAMIAIYNRHNTKCVLKTTYKQYLDYTIANCNSSSSFKGETHDNVQARCNQWYAEYGNCTGYNFTNESPATTISGMFVNFPQFLDRSQLPLHGSTTVSGVYLREIKEDTAWACLESASPEELVRYTTNIGPNRDTFFHNKWSPVIDKVTLLKTIPDLIDEGKGGSIDVLTGSNLDEGSEFITYTTLYLDPTMQRADFLSWCAQTFSTPIAQDINANNYYTLNHDLIEPLPMDYNIGLSSDSYISAVRAGGDSEFRCRSMQILKSSTSAHKYLYHFRHTSIMDIEHKTANLYYGSYHGLELEYLFQYSHPVSSTNPLATNTVGEKQLMKNMACYWSNFAASGSPSSGTVCQPTTTGVLWEPFSVQTANTMIFEANTPDDISRMSEENLDYSRCLVLLQKQIPASKDVV